ncbi:hypothetical protein [uncultured Winogradskyella sp.]|uniref:hypothetical protein n=1 Tax=uncultured Winogradskyella sp. TaxID=395353 RepID=UPI00260904EF|nr:hypothetical protein [uncultured Winogradskyella sp.]
MNVISTAPNGIVNSDTIFDFEQDQELVSASYSGGKIRKGYLVGNVKDNQLHFSYCQIRYNGMMDHGTSICEISYENGKLILKENFEMSSENRKEIGVNIFKQL